MQPWNKNTKDITCVFLCAGKGSRFTPIPGKQKVVHHVHDKPLLYHVTQFWKQFSNNFVFVVGHQKDKVIDFANTLDTKATFVEQPELHGIAHAIHLAEKVVSDKFIVVLGDCLCRGTFDFPENLDQGVGVWETDQIEDIQRSYSIKINDDNTIKQVVEKPKNPPNNLCGMGFYFLDRKVFDYIKMTPPSALRNEIEITDVLQKMIESGEKLSPLKFAGDYLNVTYPEDIKHAAEILTRNS